MYTQLHRVEPNTEIPRGGLGYDPTAESAWGILLEATYRTNDKDMVYFNTNKGWIGVTLQSLHITNCDDTHQVDNLRLISPEIGPPLVTSNSASRELTLF